MLRHRRSGEQEGYSPKWKWSKPFGRSVGVRKVDVEHRTHLAVNSGRTEERDHVEDYSHEGAQARSGVKLFEGTNSDQETLGKLKAYRHVPISSIDRGDVLG